MRIHVLGSGAGGGVPQWNCGCQNCREARAGGGDVHPRTQSSLCVSVDGHHWVLLNASPDVRLQLMDFPPVHPPEGVLRGSGVSAIVLTNADIDHTAGLLTLREGGAPPIYSTRRVHRALTEGLSILPVLSAYGPVQWRELPLEQPVIIRDRAGASTGVSITAFPVLSKPAPYMIPLLADEPHDDRSGDTVGLLITAQGHGTAAYVPGVRDLDEPLARHLSHADVILIDGTFYTDDEMLALGISSKTARMMGHAPLSGPDGIVAFLSRFPRARKILVHINNTNPVLVEGSEARQEIERAGVEVSHDGLEIVL